MPRGTEPRWRGRWIFRSAGRKSPSHARHALPRRPCAYSPPYIRAPVSRFPALPGRTPEKRLPALHCRYSSARRSSGRPALASGRGRSSKKRSPRSSPRARRTARFRRRKRGCAPCSVSAVTAAAAVSRSWKRKWRRRRKILPPWKRPRQSLPGRRKWRRMPASTR